MTKFHLTRREAIEQTIMPALAGFESDYDVQAIADEAITYVDGDGFDVVEHEEFWQIVERHDISGQGDASSERKLYLGAGVEIDERHHMGHSHPDDICTVPGCEICPA